MIEIRPVMQSDYAAWSELWAGYLAYYETALPDAQFALTFARIRDPQKPQMQGRLAMRGGKAVGLVHFMTHDHFWRAEPVVYLQDLFTAPEARGGGVARQMITHVYDYAAENNLGPVYWMTQDFNATARALYDRIAVKTPFIKYQQP